MKNTCPIILNNIENIWVCFIKKHTDIQTYTSINININNRIKIQSPSWHSDLNPETNVHTTIFVFLDSVDL